MSHEVFYHFPQTPGPARRCGARGGKATARNRRQRQESVAAGMTAALASEAELAVETTAAAIALLDAQFPWLRASERRAH
jgi:hypothetical protein